MKRRRNPAVRSAQLACALVLSGCGAGTDANRNDGAERKVGTVGEALNAPTERAFVATDSVSGSINVLPANAFNGSGGQVSVQWLGTGQYQVTFSNLHSSAGNAQVVAVGVTPERCGVVSSGVVESDTIIRVDCYRGTARADSRFVALYDNELRRANGGGAFVRSLDGTVTHTPDSTYSFNPTGAANKIERLGTGAYVVHFPGLTDGFGNAQVTAFNAGSGYCQSYGWLTTQNEVQVGVYCWNSAGASVDAQFDVLYNLHTTPTKSWNRAFAYMDSFAASSTPNMSYQQNDIAQDTASISASRIGAGLYIETFPQMSAGWHAVPLVTAIGFTGGPKYCKPVAWVPGTFGASAQVESACFDTNGNPGDSQTSAMLVQEQDTCDSLACFTPERLISTGANRTDDNPRLAGMANPFSIHTWTLENHWGFQTSGFPSPSSGETYGGSLGLVVRTNVPALLGPMQQSSIVLHPSTGSAVTFVSQVVARQPPWVLFPTGCVGTSCPVLPASSYPFWSAPVVLPVDHSTVWFDLVEEQGDPSIPEVPTNGFAMHLDAKVRVVPIHVDVLLDRNGNPPASYVDLFKTGSRADIAANIRKIFDLGFAKNPATASTRNASAKTVTESASLASQPDQSDATILMNTADGPYRGCNQTNGASLVQFRLMSVNFITQNLGLEQHLVSDAKDSAKDYCTEAPESPLAVSLRNATQAAGLKAGIHMIVGGRLGGPTSPHVGGTCDDGKYSFIVGAGDINGIWDPLVFPHEIGHSLGLAHVEVAGNLMRSSGPGTDLTLEECTKAYTGAAALQ